MNRLQDWEVRLYDYIQTVRDKPFKWGAMDCSTFAADCVVAIYGFDPMVKIRWKYKTRRGADGIIKRVCGGSLANFMDDCASRIHVNMARRGDVGIYNNALCVFDGERCLSFSLEDGLTLFPREWVQDVAWSFD